MKRNVRSLSLSLSVSLYICYIHIHLARDRTDNIDNTKRSGAAMHRVILKYEDVHTRIHMHVYKMPNGLAQLPIAPQKIHNQKSSGAIAPLKIHEHTHIYIYISIFVFMFSLRFNYPDSKAPLWCNT